VKEQNPLSGSSDLCHFRIRTVIRHRPNEIEPCSSLCEEHPNQLGRIAPT
jgi:hypothetical protein